MAPNQRQKDAANLYSAIMEEIKVRIAAIDMGTSGNIYMLPPPLVREHCFLQLRMCCELVALACLVAHGDLATAKWIHKTWDAGKIMGELEKLHPEFYPSSVRKHVDANGRQTLEGINPSPLLKADLLNLYERCGDVLHRGSLKKLLRDVQTPLQIHYPDITAHAQKIVDLLSVHIVAMAGGETVFVCILRNADNNQRTQVSIAERADPSKVPLG